MAERKLTDEERKILKEIARSAIERKLFGKSTKEINIPESLTEKRGAFVTLKKGGELRGCIGYIRGYLPLHKTVEEVAVEAAFHDPRFPPLSKEEWKDIELEISVLSPMRKIKTIEEIEVGKHGLYIEMQGASGLLLPQVALEYGWDRTEFLEHTCYKAGLPKDAWKSDKANIYVFSAEVF
ncbi:MAG: AmmeMemoRadiSam system protein A [Desulfobacterota bacterium]|nr:AmmeMemoRadiSam system protein A [Thermodesulfobacteriota bacterium]MDW8002284.1 AmmeMemoRadiSam system protein A [Deltaproteobacteria bacterium]